MLAVVDINFLRHGWSDLSSQKRLCSRVENGDMLARCGRAIPLLKDETNPLMLLALLKSGSCCIFDV